ncbi:LPXTG cell wall anchor domain-containing protein [Streptococcus thoraltensis]|uniref:LPXTG cell wall anchor domain-containing protein n=1 Tax=Streptococcus thoraltensis TaxID=55085 RepID=UPI000382AEA4|nr:LPXTG cell wall anchor domain-containing protein [Streptococcus thoraltensis]
MDKHKLIASAAVLAAVAGTGATVNADETTQPTQPVLGTENTATTETVETLKPQVDAAAQKVDETATTVTEAESAVEEAQAIYDAEKTVYDQTSEAITVLEDAAKQATPENIAAAESVVEDAVQDVKVAEENQATAEAEVAPAKEAVELAESVVTDAETDEATAKADVEVAQDTVTALENNEDPRIALEERVETAKEDVNIAEDNLTKVTTDGDAKTAELEAIVNTEAEKVEAAKTGKKVIVERAVGDIIEYNNTKTNKSSPVKYFGAETVSIELTDAQKEEYARTGRIAFTSDANELTKWAVYYMNELRELNGITERVEATDEAIQYAVARADEMRRNNKMSHSTDLSIGASSENISYSSRMDSLSDQELAYYLVARWYDDSYNASSSLGHRRAILFAHQGLGVAVNGVQGGDYYAAMDNIPEADAEGMINPDFIHQLGLVRKYNYKEVQDANGEWYSTINGKETVFLPKLTFIYLTDAATDVDESALNAAKSALDTHKVNLTEAVRKAEAELAEAHAELTAATEALAVAPKSEDRAQALADAKTVLAEKQAKYEAAKQETVDAKADLATAKTELSHKEAAVAETVKIVEDAKSALIKAQDALEVLQNPEGKLEELKERQWDALMNMNSAEFVLSDAVEKLNALRKEHTEAEEAYHLVKARYDALLALSGETDNDVDAPKDDKQPETPSTDDNKSDQSNSDNGSDVKPGTDAGSANSSKDAEVEMQSNGYRKSPVTAVSYGKVNAKSAVEMIASKTDDKKTYSRVAKAEILPETGSNESVVAMLVGMAITGIGLVSLKKRHN